MTGTMAEISGSKYRKLARNGIGLGDRRLSSAEARKKVRTDGHHEAGRSLRVARTIAEIVEGPRDSVAVGNMAEMQRNLSVGG